MPGLKLMFRNSLSAEGAKAVKIKAWALKARMLMPNSGRFVRLCVVRLCVRLTILNLFKVYMNLSLRFFHFKFFKVPKQIMYLWFKWIMERCYPHLRWYFLVFKNIITKHMIFRMTESMIKPMIDPISWPTPRLTHDRSHDQPLIKTKTMTNIITKGWVQIVMSGQFRNLAMSFVCEWLFIHRPALWMDNLPAVPPSIS